VIGIKLDPLELVIVFGGTGGRSSLKKDSSIALNWLVVLDFVCPHFFGYSLRESLAPLQSGIFDLSRVVNTNEALA